jgi:hypothetical protein
MKKLLKFCFLKVNLVLERFWLNVKIGQNSRSFYKLKIQFLVLKLKKGRKIQSLIKFYAFPETLFSCLRG